MPKNVIQLEFRINFLFLVLISILANSCRETPATLTETEKVKLIDAVNQTLNNYFNDIRKEGLLAEFGYLDNSAEFFWVPPGYSNSISHDSVISILKQNAPSYKSISNSWDTLKITPLTIQLVSYTGRLNSTMVDTNGKILNLKLVETGILIKREKGWKLLSGQTSILKQ